MDSSKTITHLSLCSGYGGIDIGLRRVLPTCRTIAYVEIEAFACANLVAKMEAGELDQAPIWTDLKTCDWEIFSDRVDILSGGYPCQPFSAAGQRLGKQDPRHLWPFIQRAIGIIRPGYCFFENVEGHLTLGFKDVCHDLGELGYQLTAGIFSAAECDAPHQRKRVFILANRCGAGLERFGPTQGGNSEGWQEPVGHIGTGGLPNRKWPARPGESQHEWEEPRVVADADPDRLQKCSLPDEQGQEDHKVNGKSQRQTQPVMGRATDGPPKGGLDATANRVDRLRLLGNGVVPATCEVAFRKLYEELNP